MPTLKITTIQQLRDRLELHYSDKEGVWLVFRKKLTRTYFNQIVLDLSSKYTYNPLTSLPDPVAMTPDLRIVYKTLDKTADKLYCKETFESDADRIACLFGRYKELAV